MLTVRTSLASSQIQGLGLFAVDNIPAGTVYWTFTPQWDSVPRKADLPDSLVEFWSIFCHDLGDRILVCPDNSRFVNHSDTPNTAVVDGKGICLRDIAAGEEITEDYKQAEWAMRAWLNAALKEVER